MKRPSNSARPMKGRTTFETSPAATLTAKGTKSPARASWTCSAMVTPALSWASTVEAPRWGTTTTEGSSKRGDSVVGSFSKTSRAAPCTWPERIAAARSASLTMPPRATLMMRTPRLVLVRASASRRLVVSLFLGRWIVMKSLWASRASSDRLSMPM